MKTKPLNSYEQSEAFSDTFSIYALVKNSDKTIQTLRNPSGSPGSKDSQTEELKNNPSEPFGECQKCQHHEEISPHGAGCVSKTSGNYQYEWSSIATLEDCPRGVWN
jgi:hypothetical protein